MNNWVRLILLAVAAAVIAALFDRKRRRDNPPAQWPDWSARRPPSTEHPPPDTSPESLPADTPTSPESPAADTPTSPESPPPDRSPAEKATTDGVCVEPTDGHCPDSHPVRAKKSSRIYHLPGMLNYDRMRPDVCFTTTEAAEAAGYRRSKV